MNGPQDRLDLLLRAYRAAGSFTVEDLATQVALHPKTLTPTGRRHLAEPARRAVARAAAMLLALDPDQVERWLLGTDLVTVQRRVAELADAADLRRCRGCKAFFDAEEAGFDANNGMCIPCRQAYQRERKAPPAAANYLATLRANLDAIRQASPEIALAVEQFDPRVTVTYERLAQKAAGSWRASQVGQLLVGLGLGKPRLNAERDESPNKNVAGADPRSTGKKKSSTGYRGILTAARAFRSAARRPHSRRPAGLYDPRRRQLQGSALRALPSLRAGEVLQ